MVDVLLIQSPIRDFYLTAKRTIPYGLACLAAVLIEDGFSVRIVDALATSKSRIIDLPEEMAYVHKYYGKSDQSPFALFHHFRHFGYSFEHIGKLARESHAFLVGISRPSISSCGEKVKSQLAGWPTPLNPEEATIISPAWSIEDPMGNFASIIPP
jgi:hypothetical protein